MKADAPTRLAPQPLASKRGPVARDWTARTRATALASFKYSRFVALMRRALPIAASVVIISVLMYAFVPRQSDKITMVYQRWGRIENDLAMIKPKLSGTDEKGNPFVITADHAVQDVRHPRRARLYDIEADITLDRQQWLNASATQGAFDMDTGSLDVSGGISVFSDAGYEMQTSRGHVDLHRGRFTGPDKVKGQGPLGNFVADRFEIDHATRKIYLSGDVHMTMYVHNAKVAK